MGVEDLERWMATDESVAAGGDSRRGDTSGHRAGHRIIAIKGTRKADLTDDDHEYMRTVVRQIQRHLARRPSGEDADRWQHSLMNWGHDHRRRVPELSVDGWEPGEGATADPSAGSDPAARSDPGPGPGLGLGLGPAELPVPIDELVAIMEDALAPVGGDGELELASGPGLSMRLWNEPRPGIGPLRRYDGETGGYAISGAARLEVDDDFLLVTAGMSWMVPAGVAHRFVVDEAFCAIEATRVP